MTGILLLAALVELGGVTGEGLRARAFFDANNVKVGDPLILTIDFLGEADFSNLHPPALARHVDRRDWKLDDTSAKTETYRDARRLTYRVRPMREGVVWFPSLEFAYADAAGGARRTVKSNEIPVHAKVGAQVVVEGMDEMDDGKLPPAPALVTDPNYADPRPTPLSDDTLFAWRRACAAPKADAFTAFDFPAARLNEASSAIREGSWARALKVYSRLEWRIGQTPDIERGIVAALALRYDNPLAELPVWRQVGRPLLKYPWPGRVGLVLGGFAALALLFWLLGRTIRAVAALALFAAFALPANGQGVFEQMEQEMQRMRQRMQQMSSGFGSGFSMSFGGAESREPVKIVASLDLSTTNLQVGATFDYLICLEAPRTSSIGQVQITPSQTFGLKVVGDVRNLADARATNPTNVIKRLAVPVRYDVPFKGKVAFTISGMVSGRQTSRRGNFTYSFSNSFRVQTDPLEINVKPLSTDGQPKDFAGVVSEGLILNEGLDLTTVGTNDVIQITYRMIPNGYVPADFLPPGAAFEMNRDARTGAIEYRRFFVADGAPATPKVSVSYYDPRQKAYRHVTTGATPIHYKPE